LHDEDIIASRTARRSKEALSHVDVRNKIYTMLNSKNYIQMITRIFNKSSASAEISDGVELH